jgi:CRP-like cAMP-binding protein
LLSRTGSNHPEVLREGAWFGERSVFLGEPCDFSAAVNEDDTMVYFLTRNDYYSLVEPNLRRLIQRQLRFNTIPIPTLDELVLKCLPSQATALAHSLSVESTVNLARYTLSIYSKDLIERLTLEENIASERRVALQFKDHPFIVKTKCTYKD